MDENNSGDKVDLICELLKVTDLENEELLVDCESVVEVENRGKNNLFVKVLISKYYN